MQWIFSTTRRREWQPQEISTIPPSSLMSVTLLDLNLNCSPGNAAQLKAPLPTLKM